MAAEGFLRIAAGELSYIDVGHGRTAMFLHGIGTNALLWRNVIAQVSGEHRRCIALDLPNALTNLSLTFKITGPKIARRWAQRRLAGGDVRFRTEH